MLYFNLYPINTGAPGLKPIEPTTLLSNFAVMLIGGKYVWAKGTELTWAVAGRRLDRSSEHFTTVLSAHSLHAGLVSTVAAF